jgi:hypothetical protein
MKSKVFYGLAVLNVLTIAAAFAGERKHSEVSSRDGVEGQESSLCSEVLRDAEKLPACDGKDEQGLPQSVEVDQGCNTRFYQEHPGDNDLKVSVKAGARWSCDSK